MRFVAQMFRGVIVWLFPILVLAACDTGTEPELQPDGWQVVVESSSTPVNTAAGRSIERARSFYQLTVFDLSTEKDTVFVGYEHWVWGSEGERIKLAADLTISPSVRYPVLIHEPVVFAEIYDTNLTRRLTTVVSPTSQGGSRSASFSYQYHKGFAIRAFFLWPLTCQKEGRSTLRSSGIVIQYQLDGGEGIFTSPEIIVTCHRQVSSASRVTS